MLTTLKSVLIWTLIASAVTGFLPSGSEAAFLPSGVYAAPGSTPLDRQESMGKIQSVLESKQIHQRLLDLGLTKEEISLRLGRLSDGQIHELATRLDTLQPGGDALGGIVVLLVIAILVVVLLQITGHKVIITK